MKDLNTLFLEASFFEIFQKFRFQFRFGQIQRSFVLNCFWDGLIDKFLKGCGTDLLQHFCDFRLCRAIVSALKLDSIRKVNLHTFFNGSCDE